MYFEQTDVDIFSTVFFFSSIFTTNYNESVYKDKKNVHEGTFALKEWMKIKKQKNTKKPSVQTKKMCHKTDFNSQSLRSR